MLKKTIYTAFIILSLTFVVRAEEGMLIPTLIGAFESDMQAMGMKLTAEEIYSVNQSSLKDAILHFGGGCTAELVSKHGLLLTNHHCGYAQIQAHSSLENDYLKHGFWAKDRSQELPNKGLTASRIVRIQDVTKEVFFGLSADLTSSDSAIHIKSNINRLEKEAINGTHYKSEIKAFNYGNEYYLIVQETFLDVRLVGTPPNSIGKFGGDTDNWVWPRHTGDFSVFRIYADANNQPAEYSTSNRPYIPLHFFKLALNDRKSGDFTMVYGFPGETEQHVSSEYLRFIIEKERPARIQMRRASLNIIDKAMLESDEIRIKYASKQSRISNAYKKWIGQIDGLRRLDAVRVKQEYEKAYTERANSNPQWKEQYGTIVEQLNKLAERQSKVDYEIAWYYEYCRGGTEFFQLISNLRTVQFQTETNPQQADLYKKRYLDQAEEWFKNYDANIDKQVFIAQSNILFQHFPEYQLDKHTATNNYNADHIFAKSIFTDKKKYTDMLRNFTPKTVKKLGKQLEKDPGYQYYFAIYNKLIEYYKANVTEVYKDLDHLMKQYVKGKYEMFPEHKHWPDANSTLRIAYGKLEGSHPRDGVHYLEYTTLDGVIDKYYSGESDFTISPRLLELHESKNYGKYAQNGELWVCFTGSNHTTGGNSGSPVIDANGNLMGLNFDRSWESTMSDYLFDPSRCRNIVVDIRYVLWVMDIYAGASHLVEEMEIAF